MIKTGSSALESCSFTVHLNESGSESLNKLPIEITFNDVLSELENKVGIYLPATTYSFWIKTGIEEKKSIFSAEKWMKTQDKFEGFIPVKMDDTVAGSTYRPFYKHGRMEIWLRPPTTDADKTKIFETSLNVLYSRTNTPPTTLLPILKSLFDVVNSKGLDEVGIFRLSGSAKEGNEIKKDLDQGKPLKSDIDVILAASLIKYFFRNLPEPLISGEYWEQIRVIFSDNQDGEDKTEELRTVIQGMPSINVTVLENLMALCRSVTKHQEVNKMTNENISIVIGPNIMGPRTEDATSLMDTSLVCVIAKYMIEYYSYLFINNSPYDSELKGWRETQDMNLRLALSPAKSKGPKLEPTSTSPTIPSDKKNNKIFRGHMPRSVFENKPIPSSESIDRLRLTSESLVSYSNNELEWELPYDTISNVAIQGENVTVQYKKVKKSDHTATLSVTYQQGRLAFSYMYSLQDWCEHFQYVLSQYQSFVEMANQDPDRYGAVVSKDAFLLAKKKKEAAKGITNNSKPSSPNIVTKSVESPKVIKTPEVAPVQVTPLPVIPTDEESESGYGEDEYDSDSDDSIEFRTNKKK